jgi:hypothetical protein
MHPNVVFEPPFGLSGSLWRHQARQTGVVRLQVLVLEMAQGPSPTPITAGGFISIYITVPEETRIVVFL